MKALDACHLPAWQSLHCDDALCKYSPGLHDAEVFVKRDATTRRSKPYDEEVPPSGALRLPRARLVTVYASTLSLSLSGSFLVSLLMRMDRGRRSCSDFCGMIGCARPRHHAGNEENGGVLSGFMKSCELSDTWVT